MVRRVAGSTADCLPARGPPTSVGDVVAAECMSSERAEGPLVAAAAAAAAAGAAAGARMRSARLADPGGCAARKGCSRSSVAVGLAEGSFCAPDDPQLRQMHESGCEIDP